MFIDEARDTGFNLDFSRTWLDSSSIGPAVRQVQGKADTTYYYRGGTVLGQLVITSETKAVVVRRTVSVTVKLTATHDNLLLRESFNGYSTGKDAMCFPDADVGVGNAFYVFPFSTGVQYFRSLLKFDLSELIRGQVTVSSAKLRLYPSVLPADWDTKYQVAACAQAWEPTSVAFNSCPQWYAHGMAEESPPVSTSVPLIFDVTAIVKNWVSGYWLNSGLILLDNDYDPPDRSLLRTTAFESLERYTSRSRRPQLVITYTP